MKKYLFALSLLCSITLAFAKPLFTSNKYVIRCRYDANKGGLMPAAGEYKLTYKPTANPQAASDSVYWIIKEEAEGQYSIQNAATHQYIRHNTSTSVQDRWALQFVPTLQDDKSTLFTLELQRQSGLCYYAIRSVVNTAKIWERRTASQVDAISKLTVNPVGVITGSYSDIRMFVFYDADGKSVADTDILPKATQTLGAFSGQLDSLTIGGRVPAVDLNNREFFLNVMESQMNADVTMKVRFKPKNAAYTLYINKTKVESGSDYTFQSVTGTKTFPIEIRNGAVILASGTVVFSCLPYVQIFSDADLTTSYSLGRIVVTEPGNESPSEILLSQFRTRGQYAGRMPKRSYGVKLTDTDGATSLQHSFFNLRSDNSWVLDALYNDSARCRNRVSTDFWLDFSTRPYYADKEPDMVNGTRGHFVEVFLNNSYNGLYCMTEKIDRQQMKVKRLIEATGTSPAIQRGNVIKADSWSEGTWFGREDTGPMDNYNNQSEYWYAFAVKYPDMENGEPMDWKNLYDAVNTVTNAASDEVFKANLEKYFDMPVFLDYYLFLDLLLLTDNHGKNLYVSMYDQTVSPMMTLTPWDLDSSWGRFWDGTAGYRMRANQTLENFIASYVPRQSTLYKRLLQTNAWGFNDKLKTRYRELRGTYFNQESIMNRFYRNRDLFNLSGAAVRESNLWGVKTINSEMTYLSTWIKSRLSFLDKQYLGGPYTEVDPVEAPQISVSPNPVRNWLTVTNVQPGVNVQVISMQGVVVHQVPSTGDVVEIDMSPYASGVYMVKAGTAVKKVVKN